MQYKSGCLQSQTDKLQCLSGKETSATSNFSAKYFLGSNRDPKRVKQQDGVILLPCDC